MCSPSSIHISSEIHHTKIGTDRWLLIPPRKRLKKWENSTPKTIQFHFEISPLQIIGSMFFPLHMCYLMMMHSLLCLIKSESRILNYKHVVLMNLECDARINNTYFTCGKCFFYTSYFSPSTKKLLHTYMKTISKALIGIILCNSFCHNL